MNIQQINARSVLISFRTPVRIITGGELFSSLPFPLLMRFIMGRLLLVTQVCTEFVMEWDQEEMLQKAEQVRLAAQHWDRVDFTRYSMNRDSKKWELPACTGWALYEGDLSVFMPFLEAGMYLHVEKNTTIGFGTYDLYYDGGTAS